VLADVWCVGDLSPRGCESLHGRRPTRSSRCRSCTRQGPSSSRSGRCVGGRARVRAPRRQRLAALGRPTRLETWPLPKRQWNPDELTSASRSTSTPAKAPPLEGFLVDNTAGRLSFEQIHIRPNLHPPRPRVVRRHRQRLPRSRRPRQTKHQTKPNAPPRRYPKVGNWDWSGRRGAPALRGVADWRWFPPAEPTALREFP